MVEPVLNAPTLLVSLIQTAYHTDDFSLEEKFYWILCVRDVPLSVATLH